jgi:hypothetical protein
MIVGEPNKSSSSVSPNCSLASRPHHLYSTGNRHSLTKMYYIIFRALLSNPTFHLPDTLIYTDFNA